MDSNSDFQIFTSILAGKWSEPYDDGTKPWEWTGSAAILEKFIENPMENVKYGQCWVFSGVLCTCKFMNCNEPNISMILLPVGNLTLEAKAKSHDMGIVPYAFTETRALISAFTSRSRLPNK